MKNYIFQLLVLIFLLFQTLSLVKADNLAPESVTGARTISTATTELLVEKDFVLIDVRGIDDYSNGHIPGAYHLPVKSEDFSRENLQEIVTIDQAVIFYCNGINCMGSSMASVKAVKWGWTNVLYYRDGFEGWKDASLAIQISER